MFGIRKSNVSYSTNANPIRNTIISDNQDNIEIKDEEEQEDIYKSTKFIFYKQKFTNQMEIYIHLTNYKNKKLLVIIDSDSSIEGLYNQIIESIQSIPEFKNINGVRVEEIYKISNNHKINLPPEGKASDFVNSGDYLYCNLLTDEYWIKTYFNIQTLNFKKIIKLEYKLKKKMKYKRFKLMLMKAGIELFIENIKSTKKYNKFNYYLKLFEFKIKKHKKVITHNVHNKHKVKMAIDKIINFSSEIIVILKFGLFERLIHKNIKIAKAYQRNNLRVNEYNDLTFEDLINDKKFLPEFTAIKELSEEFLTTQYNTNNPKFLFYIKKKSKNSINDYFFSNQSKPNSINDKNPINELIKEEDDEEKDDKKLNDNLNIDDLKTRRESSFNSMKASEVDSFDSNKLYLNINENDDNKIVNRKKNKSLFFKGEKKDLIKEEKKEKKEKIKNVIIIAGFLIKEEKKKEKMFLRKITHQNFENKNFEFKKNLPNIKNTIKLSTSNKNVGIYDNKTNINFLMKDEDDEDDDESNQSNSKNNFKNQGYNETEKRNDSEIEFETKPKTFSDKNNNLFFKTFVDNRNNSKDELNELFLDIKYEEEQEDGKLDSQSNKNNKKNLNKINQLISESFDDNESNSNDEEEDNIEEQNNIATNKFVRQNLGRRSTYVGEKKKSLFSNLRNRNRNANFYQEIKTIFNNEIFLDKIQNIFTNACSKKIFDKIKMPQSKDIEYLEKEYKFMIETKRTKTIEDFKSGGGEYHIYIFMSILFVFSAMILICLNIDLLSLYY